MRPSRPNEIAHSLTPAFLRSWPLPVPAGDGDKEDRGRVLVVGGSAQTPGAVLLAATGALRAGAGKLQIAAPESVAQAIAIAIPEALVLALPETRRGSIATGAWRLIGSLAEKAQAVLIGPGLMEGSQVTRLVGRLLPSLKESILILDAEALKCLGENLKLFHSLQGRVIVTPHAGEMAGMLSVEKSSIQGTSRETALSFARQARVVTVLKGAETWIAAPQGALYRNRRGNVGLATSGSGDSLAGVIAGLAARGAPPVQAAAWGVFLHAAAGDRLARRLGQLGYLARELLAEIPPLMRELGRR